TRRARAPRSRSLAPHRHRGSSATASGASRGGSAAMSTMLPVPMRLFAACLVVVFASLSSPAAAQDPPPPIPWVVVDAHATVPKFSSDDADLAASRGMVA